ncbi:MAG: nucleotide exchange factor GrpE [Gloeotrichia echinulata DEX184]|jgi:hypothetical protein|nr:nucleotide exchange factor GrpE [Gloeotrichia echinulata DEX184]
MDFNLFEMLAGWCPWEQKEREAKKLALQIESQARGLNNLPEAAPDNIHSDLLDILKTSWLLLDRFTSDRVIETPTPEIVIVEETAIEPSEPSTPVIEPTPPPFMIAKDPEPSNTAKELIKLRDNILLAITENTTGDVRMFQSLYRKIGKILEQEGVFTLEAMEKFNYEQQQIIETRPTEDTNLDCLVCSTIRPGYLFDGKLIRPQEVIVYNLLVE